MKKLTLVTIFAALMMISSAAVAQTTANGTLNVTATVTGTISLVFNSDGSGVNLGGAGTANATLAFGTVQAFGGTLTTGVTRSNTATSFTVSSPVDIFVDKSNVNSANYKLTAQLNTADAINSWSVAGIPVTNASAAVITSTGTYTNNVPTVVALTIPYSNSTSLNISNSIAFVATAN